MPVPRDSFIRDRINFPNSSESPLLPRESTSSEIELEPIEDISTKSPTTEITQASTERNLEDGRTSKASQKPNLRPKNPLTAGNNLAEDIPAQDTGGTGSETETFSMGRKSPAPSLDLSGPQSTASGGQNGHARGDMESYLRRKHTSTDSQTSASQAANLMSREDFSLDDDPPPRPSATNLDTSFFELPTQDRRNFLLLILLYFLQGIPMGLALGSVPIILKKHLSYGQIGVFSLAAYPYSLKLLWSPIVDALWSPVLGRRKSWILPIQMLSGFGMIYLGSRIKEMMALAGAEDGSGIWAFTWWWFFLVFLCATQDIAVDGWALRLLSLPNLSYASTAQTVGLTAGQFLSYTVFLALNSPEFANRWFRASDGEEGLLTLEGYLTFWGWSYILVTVALAIFNREAKTDERDGILGVYRIMIGILKLKNIQTIIIIHLIAKLGFQANEAVTNLKLLDKGFGQDNLSLTVLIDFPFEIFLGYYAGRWSTIYQPITVWSWAFIARLIAAAVAQATVMMFPKEGVQTWYLLAVIASHIFSTFSGTVMFVAISAFHAKISDPVIGGTYMTLLATVSNLGGTFPKIFVLELVDYFTVASCNPPLERPKGFEGELITSPFSCALEADKTRCLAGAGVCHTTRDGYYIVNVLCIIIGTATFLGYIRPAAKKLQNLPLRAWRLAADETQRY